MRNFVFAISFYVGGLAKLSNDDVGKKEALQEQNIRMHETALTCHII